MDDRKLITYLAGHIEALSRFTATPGAGVTRLPFTTEARRAADYLRAEMAAQGLAVWEDASGAVCGRWQGREDRTILVGSHYDSVRGGGAYDGAAGIVCGLGAVALLKEQGLAPDLSIEVVATNDEEGARFKDGFFSAKAMAGLHSPRELIARVDEGGISVAKAMEQYGLDPLRIGEARREPGSLHCFLEVHVEQGPVLESRGVPIGIVEAIAGINRYLIRLEGRPDHAGTTPMELRLDPLGVFGEVAGELEAITGRYPGAVATVGHMAVTPNEINTVPGQVVFSLDIRSVDRDALEGLTDQLLGRLRERAQARGIGCAVHKTLSAPPVRLDGRLGARMEGICARRGIPSIRLNSGAGHDSMVMAGITDAAMLFVPSKGGRSHCPEEYTDPKDLALAARILAETVAGLSTSDKPNH